ncbi:MAG: adenylate/guanylate cyclase domain-containing protein [Limisphaerales bacterium]
MRVIYSYQGKEEIRTFERAEILIGRLSPLSAPDLDLGADPTVSRKHCRIKVVDGTVQIEDLRSTNGTVVDGEYVENPTPITPQSVIRTGETSVRVEFAPPAAKPAAAKAVQPKPDPAPLIPAVNVMAPPASAAAGVSHGILPSKPGAGAVPVGTPLVAKPPQPPAAAPAPAAPAPSEAPKAEAPVKPAAPAPASPPPSTPTASSAPATPPPAPAPVVAAPAPSTAPAVPVSGPVPQDLPADASFKRRLADLYRVPLAFTPDMRLPEMLQAVLARVLTLIPGAKRGALMLHDLASGRVQVVASIPQGEVVISESLARRVMDEGHGFILQRNNEAGALDTRLVTVETGMYAPLLLKEKPLGAIYLDDPKHSEAFSEDDMQFLLAVAHYIAVVIFNHQLQSDLLHNSTLLDRISVKFPPRVQERLLENLRQEKLKPGAQKSELPVLFAGLRGFASINGMAPADAAAMFRDYQAAMVETVFRYDGTLVKSGGEELVAVFGAPESDLQQSEKAMCAAVEMETAIREINTRRRAQNAPVWQLAVGVHIGEVLHGFFGTPERMEFNVLGAGVTRAMHYCKGAHDGEVLIGPEVYQKVFKIIEADRSTVSLEGIGEFHCYRVKSLKGAKPA